MRALRNNKNMLNSYELIKNWKEKSQKYILELGVLLDKIENIENNELKKEILTKVLKCDNELTLFAEQLFEEYYKKGYKDAKEKS